MQSIILDLRLSDLISNEEEANLRFHAVHFLRKHDLKPHVLPVCFFAGKIQRALDEGSVDTLGVSILKEAFLLFLALLTEIGLVSSLAQETLRSLSFVNQPQNYYHTSVRSLVRVLCCCICICPHASFEDACLIPQTLSKAERCVALQVRKRMVHGVKAVVATLSKLVQGADKAMLSRQLISDVTALCDDALIELHYSQLLLPKQVSFINAASLSACLIKKLMQFIKRLINAATCGYTFVLADPQLLSALDDSVHVLVLAVCSVFVPLTHLCAPEISVALARWMPLLFCNSIRQQCT